VLVLATCERFEAYATGVGDEGALRELIDALFVGEASGARERIVAHRLGPCAAEHLLRVASGLDSRLVGEPHVLGQVRRAGERAEAAGVIGSAMARLVEAAVRCGRRVRNETSLGKAAATYAGVATERVVRSVGAPATARVGIIGTGAVAMEVGEGLRARGVGSLVVLGRHADRTARLARHLRAEALGLDRLAETVGGLDALVTATSAPRAMVGPSNLRAARGLLVVDLGMPANVAREGVERASIVYAGLDELSPGHTPPGAIVREAERIVGEELARLVGLFRQGRVRSARGAHRAHRAEGVRR
jgi:glutamyl-tRNA reductase